MRLFNIFVRRLKRDQCNTCEKTVNKLSSRGLCADCEWALHHAPTYNQHIKRLDEEIAIRTEALEDLAWKLEAAKLSRRIVLEDNVAIRATLAKAYRKIKKLESVEDNI